MIFENDKEQQAKRLPRNRVATPTPFSGLGMLPPQSIDLEEVILGALMLQRVNDTVWAKVKSGIFYVDKHQKICQAILNLKTQNRPIDLMTVNSELKRLGELELIGGSYYLTELTSRVSNASNIEFHLLIVHQKFMQREVIRMSTEAIQSAYQDTGDVFDIIDKVTTGVRDLRKGIFSNKSKDSKYLTQELRDDLLKKRNDGLVGPGTGIRGLDYILKGDAPGDVRLIEASTSVGKSALACSEVVNCCFDWNEKGEIYLKEKQTPVAVFNLEMSSLKYSIRLMANISSIDKDIISLKTFNEIEKNRYEHYLNMYEQAQIYIDDCDGGITINEFEFSVADLVEKYGVQKIVIDTVQLMKGDPSLMRINNTRELQLADNSRRVKACAKKYGITIIELAQLNDDPRKAKHGIPTLGMTRECKAIEHDADNIILIWRPDYMEDVLDTLQEINCSQFQLKITDFKDVAFLIVAKNREGMRCKVPVKFKGSLMRLSDHPLVLDFLNGNLLQSIERDAPF